MAMTKRDFTTEGNKLVEKVVKINRVNKVLKGGKRLSFRALVIVGDNNGKVSVAIGKSKEVPSAIKKAIEKAKKSLRKFNIVDETIPHEVIGRFNATKVVMRPAKTGTGVIAGGAVRLVLEAAGIRNVIAKIVGSTHVINSAKAALDGLSQLLDKETLEKERGVKLHVRSYKRKDIDFDAQTKKMETVIVKEDTKKRSVGKTDNVIKKAAAPKEIKKEAVKKKLEDKPVVKEKVSGKSAEKKVEGSKDE